MTKILISPEQEKKFTQLGALTLLTLENFFSESIVTDDKKDFRNDIYRPMLIDPDTTGERVLGEMRKLQSSGGPVNLKLVPMLVSCAFLAQAMKEQSRNEHDNAWFYMAEARYWCGVVMASKGIEAARNKTVVATRKNTASKGGLTRADKYIELKNEVFRLARELCPKANGWKSRRDASINILEPFMIFMNKNKSLLSVTQIPQTIYNWLKEMPDAELLFPKKT